MRLLSDVKTFILAFLAFRTGTCRLSYTSKAAGSIERTLLLTLVRGPKDEASFSPGYQRELRQFLNLARAEGGEISALSFALTHADRDDGLVGEFIIPSTPVADSPLRAAANAWLLGRAGRRLRLTLDDHPVEGNSLSELFCLLSLSMAVNPPSGLAQTADV
jgi:hypothetical protein